MKTTIAAGLVLALAGCAGQSPREQRGTALGVGLGAAAGAIISGGDPGATLGGAAIGGVIGASSSQDRYYNDRRYYRDPYGRDRYYDGRRGYRY